VARVAASAKAAILLLLLLLWWCHRLQPTDIFQRSFLSVTTLLRAPSLGKALKS
jgi:hypothetical protein